MRSPSRKLGGVNSSTSTEINIDSDFVVILAALLCALICVLGLVVVSRCSWIRRIFGRSPPPPPTPPPTPAANKGLKKKIIKLLPTLTYTTDNSTKLTDCAICLTEFAAGDEIRVLPQCGHGFHVGCVDRWLRTHSSCPSCRKILVVATCKKCGGSPRSLAAGAGAQAILDHQSASQYLP